MKRLVTTFCLLLSTFTWLSAQTTLISLGSSWKYMDNGSNQGTTWKDAGFSDASWASGNAQLGYGDGDETTVVSYGSNSISKYITTYFRKSITVADASIFTGYTINVRRDDGIVVYINGTERYRNNMPTGTIAYNTLAATTCSDDGGTIQTGSIPSGALVTGTNVIAVEVHQSDITSSDISFDLELKGNTSSATAVIQRGPYLQLGTSSSVIIKWRTDIATNSKVSYGTTAGSLTSSANDAASVKDHEVKLAGLSANTKYYYSIGSSTQTLQGDANNYFITAPIVGTEKKTRVWVTGDCGNNSTNQRNSRDKYISYLGSNYTDVWLLAGDNAYNSGLDTEYQTNFFDIYKDKMLKQTVLWPAPGNHDYANNATRQNDHNVPYYSNFTLPKNAEAGGVASNTEAFYSFNYANIHFVSLDSYGKESNSYRMYDTLGPQATWLKQDLAANTQKWTIVYWHHPPYTMGSHNSDTETELINVRQNFIRILERYKVDMVICGHSHCYERTKLIKGHYGNESTFNAGSHNLSSSSGKYDGSASSCPYEKNVSSSYNGTIYVVSGSSGQLGGTQSSFPHSAMHYSDATNGGSLVIEIDQNRLDAKWVCADAVVRDQFTVFKDVRKTTNITIQSGQNTTLNASWVGNYNWTTGATSRAITVSPTTNTSYSVIDNFSCVTDVFNVTVIPARIADLNFGTDTVLTPALEVFPNPFEDKTTINYSIPFAGQVTLSLQGLNGELNKVVVKEFKEAGYYSFTLRASELDISAGIYLLKLVCGDKEIQKKVSVVK
ncbi:metallophosphoesterase [Sporocytophaga myxococcoides]|nr:metallophosphoesterase [Sporocytophaga myxococcoides]